MTACDYADIAKKNRIRQLILQILPGLVETQNKGFW